MSAVVWFRRDLRLDDNPAWAAATLDHDRVIALFVVDPALWDRSGNHRRIQLAAHLAALDVELGRISAIRQFAQAGDEPVPVGDLQQVDRG